MKISKLALKNQIKKDNSSNLFSEHLVYTIELAPLLDFQQSLLRRLVRLK